MIKYIKGDLFTSKNSLVHCISEDIKMSAGIAKEFRKRWGVQIDRLAKIEKPKVGKCLTVCVGKRKYIFNLITKKNYYDKPTYGDLNNALMDMFKACSVFGIRTVSMPKIACGLDKLKWSIVEEMIEIYRGDVEVEVYVI